MLDRVRSFIRRERLLVAGDRVLVACSGGPDSLALLDVLDLVAPELGTELSAVVYVDHGLRAEASAEAALVEREASNRRLRFLLARTDVGGRAAQRRETLEQAGREERRRLLEAAAGDLGASSIALGHTASDQAETVLMRIVRGCGPRGLCGMLPRRGRYIRPLLEVWRRDVEEHLRRRGLSPCHDQSNESRAFFRNRVRADLLPALRRENPSLDTALARLACAAREEAKWMAALQAEALAGIGVGEPGGDGGVEGGVPGQAASGEIAVDGPALLAMPRALRLRLILEIAARLGSAWGRTQAEAVERLLEQQGGTRGMSLAGGLRVERRYQRLLFSRLAGTPRPNAGAGVWSADLVIHGPGTYAVPGRDLRLLVAEGIAPDDLDGHRQSEPVVWLDPRRATFPLRLRGPRPGDRFRPAGVSGKRKLAHLLSDVKVPLPERRRTLLLCSGDDGGEILWVVGARLSTEAAATPGTPALCMTIEMCMTIEK